MKMSPKDINPAILDDGATKIDAATFARLTAQRIDPVGPLLNLQPPAGWLLLDMPNELAPQEIGGIHVGNAVKQPSPYTVATVIRSGSAQYAEGDKVLVNRRQHPEQAHYDGRSYWRVYSDNVFAKVLP
jgi:hypothetical protein